MATDFLLINPDGRITEHTGYPGDVVGCHGSGGQTLTTTRTGSGPTQRTLRVVSCDCALAMPEKHPENLTAVYVIHALGHTQSWAGPVAIYPVDAANEPLAMTPEEIQLIRRLAAPKPDPETERELVFAGGPRDGEHDWQPKAFWPVGIFYPDPAGKTGGVWIGETVPVDPDRGHYRPDPTAGCPADGPLRMTWWAPGTWAGPLWTCSRHGFAGTDRLGCAECAYEKYSGDE